MSPNLLAERDRLLAEIQAIRDTGNVAPAGCTINTYIAKNSKGQGYEYLKLVAEQPIFTGAQGGRTRTQHLGKVGSDRHLAATLAIRRRNAIEQIQAQLNRIEKLIESDQNLPSAGDFS